jgi:hypothetical protein
MSGHTRSSCCVPDLDGYTRRPFQLDDISVGVFNVKGKPMGVEGAAGRGTPVLELSGTVGTTVARDSFDIVCEEPSAASDPAACGETGLIAGMPFSRES